MIREKEAEMAKRAKKAAEAGEKNPELLEALNPEENKTDLEDVSPKKAKCSSLFDITHVVEAWKTVLKPRPNHQRTLLILLIIVFDLEIFIIVSINI